MMVLISSITQPYWNYLAKKTNGDIPFIWLTYVTGTIFLLPFFTWTLLTTAINFSLTTAMIIFTSGALRLLYFIVLQTGYRKADLSVVYPIARGSAPFFSTIGATLILHEKMTLFSLAGMILIMGGVLVITNPKINSIDTKRRKGLYFGVGTGLIISFYTIWDKSAISNYHLPPFLLTFASNCLGAVGMAPFALRKKKELKKEIRIHKWPILAVAILSPFSYLLVLFAMKTTPVIYIAPARELSIVFAVVMGQQLMAEQDKKRRLLGSLLIVSGVISLTI
jgi:uncharacterized membrane protein